MYKTISFFASFLLVVLCQGAALTDKTFPIVVSFAKPAVYVTGAVPKSIVCGDFDKDGDIDIAIANWEANKISLLLNLGDGKFVEGSSYPATDNPMSRPKALAKADLDGDEDIDIVVISDEWNGRVFPFFNQGNGTFIEGGQYAVGVRPSSIAIGDVSGDTLPDLVIANAGSNDVCVFLNQGKGKFVNPARYNLGVMQTISSICTGDFNGDNRLDIATANFIPEVTVLLNQGNGKFAKEKQFALPGRPLSLCAGDFSSDGKLDLATASPEDDEVSVLFNQGEGNFTVSGRYTVGDGPCFILAADLNNDKRLDLVTTNRSSDDISVLISQEGGRFEKEERIRVGKGPRSACVADFNSDGKLDIAIANSGANSVSVLLSLIFLFPGFLTFFAELPIESRILIDTLSSKWRRCFWFTHYRSGFH